MPAARQAELGALPFLIRLAAGDAQAKSAGSLGHILNAQGYYSERRTASAKPNSSSERSRLPLAERSQVATSWRASSQGRAT